MKWEWEYSNSKGQFKNINLNNLTINEAYLNITSYLPKTIWMYSLSDDCVQCPYSMFESVNKHLLTKYNTAQWTSLKFYEEDHGIYILGNQTPICTIDRPNIGQGGIYNINVWKEKCDFIVVKDAVNIHLSLLYAILIMIVGGTLAFITKKYITPRLTCQSTVSLNTEMNEPNMINQRLRSLDTFRGIVIALMIFTQNGGGVYRWSRHATWDGLNLPDFLFPWFMWIMGVCIPMSIKSQINRNTSKMAMIKKVFCRSVKLFFIGICLKNNNNVLIFRYIQIMGVLQRLGIAYLVVTTLYIWLLKPMDYLSQSTRQRIFYDIRLLCSQWLVIFGFVAVHLGLIFGLPVPNCPTGYLGPGGKHEMLSHPGCVGGAAGYIDRLILGETHFHHSKILRIVYDSHYPPFNIIGIVGCLTSFLNVFIGVQCGMILIIFPKWDSRIKRWIIWAIVIGLSGGVLSGFTIYDGIIPINWKMWSLSFVLITTSLAFILLSICYILIDVIHIWSGVPFVYAGMNSIILYVGSQITKFMFPFNWRIKLIDTHFIYLIQNFGCLSLWLVIAYVLYKKKIFCSL